MNTAVTKSKASPLVITLILTMVMLVAYLVFAFFNNTEDVGKHRRNITMASELRALTTGVPRLAALASGGNTAAITELEQLQADMLNKKNALQVALTASGDSKGLVAFNEAWDRVDQAISVVTGARESLIFAVNVKAQFDANYPALQTELDKTVEILLARRTAGNQVALAQAQLWRAERVRASIDRVVLGGRGDIESMKQLGHDAELFDRVASGFKNGDRALGITKLRAPTAQTNLDNTIQLFSIVSSSAAELVDAGSALTGLRESNDALISASSVLMDEAISLVDHVKALNLGGNAYGPQATVYVGIFLILGLTLLGLIFYLGTRSRLQETAEANRVNQDAILRLLDDIEGLGEGDLTAEVTVTEGFTGAIADAINLTIVQLRELVSRIVDTAGKLSASANGTRSTVSQLTRLSERQAEEIAGASVAINEVAITIDQVSANAAESAAVADRSVSIANKGAVVVRSTIAGMDNIRGQIQDTAKRIKRLGESSQEIGDIVSLINDIADQTNILALNAAIQASMAGDAGRGFAVVADEVQRLAERSANATKQIAALVKTIQTDTYEAVSSMEQTTAEVVAGASLTEDAGIALSEIETVSTNLAELIQDISTAARHQSTTAGHISNTMNVIQDITSQTLEGTNRTAASVDELAEMAIDQRESVSGFKLPTQDFASGLLAEPFASAAMPDNTNWLDDGPVDQPEYASEEVFEQPATLLDEEEELPGFEQAGVQGTPAHVKEVLEENSAAMEEMDYLSELDTIDGDLASLEADPPAEKGSFAAGLEAELADIDL
ncbi:MAG: methyl-accepting chemotaxis protein, partial [Porticoccaceae bacterium]|nr:methyl-accepting chemotaxis protein [Porticoccaceae bacterium]